MALAFAFAFVAIAVFLLFVAGKWWFFLFVAWGDGGKIVSLYGCTAGNLAVDHKARQSLQRLRF